MISRRFRPTLWGTAAAIIGVGATLALGFWQLDRAQQKDRIAAEHARLDREPAIQLDAGTRSLESVELRQVEAFGAFEPTGVVWLDNRVRAGVAGYEVVMPLRMRDAGERVLVNRGWIAGTGDRNRLPELTTPAGELRVRGRAVVPGKRIYELGDESPESRVWQHLSIERYRKRVGIAVLPIMIEQTNDIDDGLLRVWPAAGRGADNNRSYAVQWFALAALIVVMYCVFSLRRDAANA